MTTTFLAILDKKCFCVFVYQSDRRGLIPLHSQIGRRQAATLIVPHFPSSFIAHTGAFTSLVLLPLRDRGYSKLSI